MAISIEQLERAFNTKRKANETENEYIERLNEVYYENIINGYEVLIDSIHTNLKSNLTTLKTLKRYGCKEDLENHKKNIEKMLEIEKNTFSDILDFYKKIYN